MASNLGDLIRVAESLVLQFTEYQEWPTWNKQMLRTQLDRVSPARFSRFQKKHQSLVSKLETEAVRAIVRRTELGLEVASAKIGKLRSNLDEGKLVEGYKGRQQCGRIVCAAIDNVVYALKCFDTVGDDLLGYKDDAWHIVWAYFEEVYDFLIILGSLAFPPGSDSIISQSREYLDDIRNHGFQFRISSKDLQVSDLFLGDIISHVTAVPPNHLPCFPEQPIYVHNAGPYGNSLVPNW